MSHTVGINNLFSIMNNNNNNNNEEFFKFIIIISSLLFRVLFLVLFIYRYDKRTKI